MAAATQTTVYDVADCKVYALLTDTAGASPTYGAAVDVTGVSQVSLDPNVLTAEVNGDSTVIAKRGKIDRLKSKVQFAYVSLPVINVITGGTLTALGVDPTAEARWDFYGGKALPYFKLEFLIAGVDSGSALSELQVILYKCIITVESFMAQSYNTFGQPSFDLEAIQPVNTSVGMGRIRILDAATGLSA
jgi:hypothetical protein